MSKMEASVHARLAFRGLSAGKLQWRFAGGLRAGLPSLGVGGDYWWFLWGLAVFVGLGDGSFLGVCVCVGGGGGGREGWIGACGLCPRSRARCMCAPRLRRFILQVNFSDTLLMVSILDMIAI